MSDIDEKILAWTKPVKIKIANIEVRDCYKERNTPLIIEGDLSSYVPSVKKVVRGGSHDEQD